MSSFERETAIAPIADGRWSARLDGAWNIGDNANGGYALTPVLRAARELAGFPDPISVTTHFLRPTTGGADAEIGGELIRRGRTAATASGDLTQAGKLRLTMLASFGDLDSAVAHPAALTIDPPDLPPPDECVPRSNLEQGVDLPILSRVDTLVGPEHAVAGAEKDAMVEGWIRFCDGGDPTAMSLPFFADAFPPSLFTKFGRIGWAPTIELTVHVRRRPAPGWIRARLECDDLHDGRMIETGSLWDSDGALVARSRQIGLMLAR